jgi:hypothetical protein
MGAEQTGKRVSILVGQHGARLYQAGNLRSASQSLVMFPFKVADPCHISSADPAAREHQAAEP